MRWDGSRGLEGKATRTAGGSVARRWILGIAVATLASSGQVPESSFGGELNPQAAPSSDGEFFARMALPPAWRAGYWQSAEAKALLRLGPKAVADLVPVQSGARFCRCPACGAEERDDPLAWSIERPAVVKCRRCGVTVPDDKYPAKVNKEVPEEKVEVLPGVVHVYPYHAVEESKARYPDERLYLRAKVDYEVRKSLAKAALYCAAEYHAQPESGRDPRLAVMACALMLRFAQVYPAYATHLDQPGRTKVFQPARLNPPYRRGYQTGKWEWTGSLDVPMNLVMAYAILRGDPSWAVAGTLLGDPHPERTVEIDLLRASAEFTSKQPEEFSENSLHVYRGMFAVGRLLGDRGLEDEARTRLDGFTRRGFYHDGFWRGAEVEAHRRVVGLLEGWLGRPPARDSGVQAAPVGQGRKGRDANHGPSEPSILELARHAERRDRAASARRRGATGLLAPVPPPDGESADRSSWGEPGWPDSRSEKGKPPSTWRSAASTASAARISSDWRSGSRSAGRRSWTTWTSELPPRRAGSWPRPATTRSSSTA